MVGKEDAREEASRQREEGYLASLETIRSMRPLGEEPDFGDPDYEPSTTPYGGTQPWAAWGDERVINNGFDRTNPAEAQRIEEENGGGAL